MQLTEWQLVEEPKCWFANEFTLTVIHLPVNGQQFQARRSVQRFTKPTDHSKSVEIPIFWPRSSEGYAGVLYLPAIRIINLHQVKWRTDCQSIQMAILAHVRTAFDRFWTLKCGDYYNSLHILCNYIVCAKFVPQSPLIHSNPPLAIVLTHDSFCCYPFSRTCRSKVFSRFPAFSRV